MTRKEIKRLDKLWAEKVNKGRCEIDGTKNCQLHQHHFYGRVNRATRWYIPNGFCLSAKRHTMGIWSAHQAPEWFRNKALELRGQEWLDNLKKQSLKVFKGSFEDVKRYLDGETNNYC